MTLLKNYATPWLLATEQSSTPATPSASTAKLYPKTDDHWYVLDDTGVETKISGGGTTRDREFSFMPEFAGAVLDADGTDNSGTMTAADDATQRMNHYNWTTSEATTQDYDLVLRFRLPPEFSEWNSASKNVYMWSKVSSASGATGVQLVELLDTSGSNVLTSGSKHQNTSWTEDSEAFSGSTWTAGGIVTLRFRLFADTSENAMLGAVRLPWVAA